MKTLNYVTALAALLASVSVNAEIAKWSVEESHTSAIESRNNDRDGTAAIRYDKDESCKGQFAFILNEKVDYSEKGGDYVNVQIKVDSGETMEFSATRISDFARDMRFFFLEDDAYAQALSSYKSGDTLYARFGSPYSDSFGTTYIFNLNGFSNGNSNSEAGCKNELNEINVW